MLSMLRQVVHRMEEPLSVLRVWGARVRRGRALMLQWQACRPKAPLPKPSSHPAQQRQCGKQPALVLDK